MNKSISKRTVILLILCVIMAIFVAYEYGFLGSPNEEATSTNEQIPPPPQTVSVAQYKEKSSDPKPQISPKTRELLDKQHNLLVAGFDAKKAEYGKQEAMAAIDLEKARAEISNEKARLEVELKQTGMQVNQEWGLGDNNANIGNNNDESNVEPILNAIISPNEVILTLGDDVTNMMVGETRNGQTLLSVNTSSRSATLRSQKGDRTIFVSTQNSRRFPIAYDGPSTESE